MNWFKKLIPNPVLQNVKKNTIPAGLWEKCTGCQTTLYISDLEKHMFVCHKCNAHMRMGARKRLTFFFDDGAYDVIGDAVKPADPLSFRDKKRYRDRLSEAKRTTGEDDALVVGKGTLFGFPVVAGAFDFAFMGGSMGAVVGERFQRAVHICMKEKRPLIMFTASGGARMQEGLQSLMQMAKTSAAVAELRESGLPFISVLTDPTMGGVSASFAMLGDVHIAEPNALIGFAGPRVIEQTVRETLPEGFQRSEFLLEHGAIDLICDRRELKRTIARIVRVLLRSDRSGALESILASAAPAGA